jgi:uncharacterized membrane-anchored protein
MNRPVKYLLIMALPLGVLLVRPLTFALVLLLGQEIRLATEPFDPRDIFRGDYVELRFAIEEVPMDLLEPGLRQEAFWADTDGIPPGWVFVTLSPDEKGIYGPVALTKDPPPGGVHVRGRLNRRWDEGITVDYGNSLRRFYVRENTGRALEDAARQGKVEAVARVWKGRIVLDRILMIPEK